MHYRQTAILLLALCAGSAAAATVDGEKIYKATCLSCHGAAVLNALYTSALNGLKMMPPRGGNPGLKDDEIKAAVDYMAGQSN